MSLTTDLMFKMDVVVCIVTLDAGGGPKTQNREGLVLLGNVVFFLKRGQGFRRRLDVGKRRRGKRYGQWSTEGASCLYKQWETVGGSLFETDGGGWWTDCGLVCKDVLELMICAVDLCDFFTFCVGFRPLVL